MLEASSKDGVGIVVKNRRLFDCFPRFALLIVFACLCCWNGRSPVAEAMAMLPSLPPRCHQFQVCSLSLSLSPSLSMYMYPSVSLSLSLSCSLSIYLSLSLSCSLLLSLALSLSLLPLPLSIDLSSLHPLTHSHHFPMYDGATVVRYHGSAQIGG